MSFKSAKLRVLMQAMADLTAPECASTCQLPHSCCDPMYCELTEDYAREVYGIQLISSKEHPTLPFMSSTGCVVEPYLRPMCTLHTCEINSWGFKRDDPDWTKEYFQLRDKIDILQMEVERDMMKGRIS